ncbi:hypothetical protein [Streptomyces sp. NPDC001933]|uniref:hypothetical protein n=1 Tax=Streptomyces sp. NPDC001933 TaxID=3364626 RepID=UPI00367C4F60
MAEVLRAGQRLNGLQELPCAFPTRVPALFGLPVLADNLAEGYVLKPAGEWPEAGPGAGVRPVVKVKQEAFAEDERFDGARPCLVPPQGAAGVPAWLLVQASALLTRARAAAAVSKLGPRTSVDAVAEEITRGVSEELSEALGGVEEPLLRALGEPFGRGSAPWRRSTPRTAPPPAAGGTEPGITEPGAWSPRDGRARLKQGPAV